MKKKLILALSIFVASFAVNIDSASAYSLSTKNVTQQDQTPEQKTAKQVQRLTKSLTLTNDQVAQIQPMLLELNQKRGSMRDAADKRVAMKEMRDLVSAQNDKMKTILTADQFAKYEDIKDDARERMKGKKGRRGESK